MAKSIELHDYVAHPGDVLRDSLQQGGRWDVNNHCDHHETFFLACLDFGILELIISVASFFFYFCFLERVVKRIIDVI